MRWLVLLLVLAVTASAKDRISLIEFYGYEGLDLHKVQRALHVKRGQTPSDLTVDVVEEDIRRVLGMEAADVTMVCCDNTGGYVVYIGLPGKSVHEFPYRDRPTDELKLPEEMLDLIEQIDTAIAAAVKQGGTASQEDDSAGYALLGDPAARSLQLQLRAFAVKYEPEILRVLNGSSKEDQRVAAAVALGYASRSQRQIEALVDACRDSNDLVRNNATRALGVLLRASPDLKVPATLFIDMLSSPTWTDRNKAGLVLLELTRTRDAAILQELRTKALVPLIEMAQWQDEGHAYFARVLIARIAGIPEAKIPELSTNRRAGEIIRAARAL